MRLLGWALVLYKHKMIDVLIKTGNLDTDIHIRRTPCEDEDRDWKDVSTSQGAPKIDSKPPEARRVARNRSPSQP